MVTIEAEGWVTLREASQLTGYSSDYLRNLAHQGEAGLVKVGYIWMAHVETLLERRRRGQHG